MEAQEILNELISYHDDLAYVAVMDEDAGERDKAFIKAEALREVLGRVADAIKKPDERTLFGKALEDHYKAISKKFFYNRNVVKE
jgi:hypothetical protein